MSKGKGGAGGCKENKEGEKRRRRRRRRRRRYLRSLASDDGLNEKTSRPLNHQSTLQREKTYEIHMRKGRRKEDWRVTVDEGKGKKRKTTKERGR